MKLTMRTLTVLFALTAGAAATGCTADTGSSDDNYVIENEGAEAPAYFDLTQSDADGQFYFTLKSANHQVVLQSEGYTSKSGAENGIESVKNNGVFAEQFEVLEASDGQFYFVLKAKNHEVIGVSETYVSKSNAERGVETVDRLVTELNRYEAAENGGARFDMFRGENDEYYFNLEAANGEIVLSSEGYTSKSGAMNGMESVRENGGDLEQYEVREAEDGQFYFVLKAKNHEIIGMGELYVSKSNAERGLETVAELIASEKVANAR
jgi:uncharacterized protein YegP (UPF0339 family)